MKSSKLSKLRLIQSPPLKKQHKRKKHLRRSPRRKSNLRKRRTNKSKNKLSKFPQVKKKEPSS